MVDSEKRKMQYSVRVVLQPLFCTTASVRTRNSAHGVTVGQCVEPRGKL